MLPQLSRGYPKDVKQGMREGRRGAPRGGLRRPERKTIFVRLGVSKNKQRERTEGME